MKLTTKGEATKQRIIEGAAAHLRSDEPGEMTLDDVRAKTGTSKGQLFHYFPGGKEELLLAVARLEAQRVLDDQQPHLGALTSWAAWDAWRDAVVARYRAQGTSCPLASLMRQVGSTPGAAEVATALLTTWRNHVRTGILQMQESGLVSASVDADQLSAAFLAGIQGGVVILRSTGTTAFLEASLDTLLIQLRNEAPAERRHTSTAALA